MEIQFYGSVREVTGSMHLLTVEGKKILLECGLYQGKRQLSIEKNKSFPFDPSTVDALVLSHAHIDHSGNIPQLVRKGYKGNIYCTHATHDLATIMLRDAAHIQEKDAEFLNKRLHRTGNSSITPIYTMEDAEKSLHQFVGIGYGRPFLISPEVQVTFFDAGHILGSAVVQLDVNENGRTVRIVFTGDLGRKNLPLIQDPFQLSTADVYITESTYGNKKHDSIGDMKDNLRSIVQETVDRGKNRDPGIFSRADSGTGIFSSSPVR